MRIKKNGYVGIGTNDPAFPLDCRKGSAQFRHATDNVGVTIAVESATKNPYLRYRCINATTSWSAGIKNSGSDEYIITYQSANVNATPTSGTNLFTIKTDGKVGISKASPEYTLDVVGDINLTGDLRIDGELYPYNSNSSLGYAGFGLRNNSSNNLWDPNHFYNGQSKSWSSFSGGNSGFNIMWRESDGTIKVRRQDNTHGTHTYGKFVGPLVFGNGTQSSNFTEVGLCWDKPWSNNGAYMR